MPQQIELPGLDPQSLDIELGANYPLPFKAPLAERVKRRLGPKLGLRHLGANLLELAPGSWSSQRHWHSREDEMIYVIQGEVTLLTSAGAQRLLAGMTAGFPAGVEDGHHLINHSADVAMVLEVGTKHRDDVVTFPDIDLVEEFTSAGRKFKDREGQPY